MTGDPGRVPEGESGTYVLLLHLPRTQPIDVGRLGRIGFEQGDYCYVGSAFGSGGLRARLRHHARIAPRPHWHIDYLRRYMALTGALISRAPVRREHAWAAACAALAGIRVPAAGLGASDCACATHLFHLGPGLDSGRIAQAIQSLDGNIQHLGGAALKKMCAGSQ